MSNLAEVIPYDEQARRYFGITKYRTEAQEEAAYEHECQKEMKALREELHPLLEEVGDGFLFENDRVQAKMVDIIRDRAAKIVAICEDHADIEGNGI